MAARSSVRSDGNPFADAVSAVGGNAARLCLVPAEWIEACIRVAPCEDWRIILALARYAGMRSHECRIQRWEDIDLANSRMVVRSNKTPPVRSCPIFPELCPTCCERGKWHRQGLSLSKTGTPQTPTC